jgi:hypothetical protein
LRAANWGGAFGSGEVFAGSGAASFVLGAAATISGTAETAGVARPFSVAAEPDAESVERGTRTIHQRGGGDWSWDFAAAAFAPGALLTAVGLE